MRSLQPMPEASGANAQEDLALISLAQTILTPAAEHEWDLLRELVAFADKLVVAFIFADRFPVRVLRARLEQETRNEDLPFRLLVCDTARELREEALAKVLSPTADHEVTWFEAFGSEGELRDAWFFAAQRWNEHREPLRRSSLLALIVAAPIWAKSVIRLAAPDLWSITNLVIEPAAQPAPSVLFSLEPEQRLGGGTPAELELIARRVERILTQPRKERRELDLIEAVGSAAEIGAWLDAKRAAEALLISPELLARLRQEAREGHGERLAGLASTLNQFEIGLSNLGRTSDALQVANRVVELYRELAAARPGVFLLPLASSLNNLGNRYNQAEQLAEAQQALEEAVGISREWAHHSPEIPEELAMSLTNLSRVLGQQGQLEEALKTATEAQEIYRALATNYPARFQRDLAIGLNNLGFCWREIGRPGNALLVFQEAVELARSLDAIRPDFGKTLLAGSLNNLGNVLGDLGHLEQAAAAAEESVAIMISLVRERPQFFDCTLKPMASRLADLLAAIHHDPSDNKVLQEALAVLRQLEQAQTLPAAEVTGNGPENQDK